MIFHLIMFDISYQSEILINQIAFFLSQFFFFFAHFMCISYSMINDNANKHKTQPC